MSFADFTGKVVTRAWGKSKMTIATAVVRGDLLAREGVLADADANLPAYRVAIEDGTSGDNIAVAEGTEIRKRSTIGDRGVPSKGDHGGTATDVLWLDDTAGDATEGPAASIAQIVGYVIDTERIVLEPAKTYDPLAELVAANKTLDAQDSGKQMYVVADAKTVTLPATSLGIWYDIVNGGQQGDILVTVSPNAADKIMGPDFAGTDNKDYQNTKATARPGDRITLVADGTDGWFVTKLVGTWAKET